MMNASKIQLKNKHPCERGKGGTKCGDTLKVFKIMLNLKPSLIK
jgi:hypothetical protein